LAKPRNFLRTDTGQLEASRRRAEAATERADKSVVSRLFFEVIDYEDGLGALVSLQFQPELFSIAAKTEMPPPDPVMPGRPDRA